MAKIEEGSLESIRFDRHNANKGSVRGRGQIEASLREFGFADAGTLDKNNTIIGLLWILIPIAFLRAVFSIARWVRLKIFFAGRARIIYFSRRRITLVLCTTFQRTKLLSHLVRNEFLPADGAHFVSVYPITMLITMTLQAKSNTVINIVSGFRMLAPFLFVMSLQDSAALSAFLARVVVASYNGKSPFLVLCTLLLNRTFSLFGVVTSLVVRLPRSLFHSIVKNLFSFFRRKKLFSGFGEFVPSEWIDIGAGSATIDGCCSFCLELFFASLTNLFHKKTSYRNQLACLSRAYRMTIEGVTNYNTVCAN